MLKFDWNFWWVVAQVWASIYTLAWFVEQIMLNNKEEKTHWSQQDWWVNRREHRFDDLRDDDPDKPNLFGEG